MGHFHPDKKIWALTAVAYNWAPKGVPNVHENDFYLV